MLGMKAVLQLSHSFLSLLTNPGCETIVTLFASILHSKTEIIFLLSQPTCAVPGTISKVFFFPKRIL